MRLTTLEAIADCVARHPRRRGSRRLLAVRGRYRGLPLERARSGAEVRALELLRAGGYVLPRLNVRIAGEEADLSWAAVRVLIEVDGGPFHLDLGEDARKRTLWEHAGWTVQAGRLRMFPAQSGSPGNRTPKRSIRPGTLAGSISSS